MPVQTQGKHFPSFPLFLAQVKNCIYAGVPREGEGSINEFPEHWPRPARALLGVCRPRLRPDYKWRQFSNVFILQLLGLDFRPQPFNGLDHLGPPGGQIGTLWLAVLGA